MIVLFIPSPYNMTYAQVHCKNGVYIKKLFIIIG